MNMEQMKEKYQGIIQFQCELLLEQVAAIVPAIVSLLALPFDQQVYRRKQEQNKVYVTHHKQDPRCLLLIEFSRYFSLVIVRFPEKLKRKMEALFRRVTQDPLQDTLIQQSKMNGVVKRHRLTIDIVDEYDLFATTFQQRAFWHEYVKLNNAEVPSDECQTYPELVEPICFEIGHGIELLIETGDTILQTELYLKHPSLPSKYELGWDDLGHWHPHVLRWEELEKIVYFLTMKHPDHFVVPFLLLLPFTPITQADHEQAIARKIKAAWRSLQLFTENEIETFDRQILYMPEFKWSYSSDYDVYYVGDDGWDVYSKRHLYGDFPFAALADLFRVIDSAQQTAAWGEAVAKWKRLIQQSSKAEDEDWFHRRETADWYHTSY